MWQIDQAIYNKLNSVNELNGRVWNGVAPDDSPEPFVVFQLVNGNDVWTHGARAASNIVYQVKAVGGPSRKDVDTKYQLADGALNDAVLSVSPGAVVMIRRESQFSFRETIADGRDYWHSGGNYRIIYGG